MRLSILTVGATFLVAPLCFAQMPQAAFSADVVIIGERHDNPHHHQQQAKALATLDAQAVVYEMLLPGEAAALASVEATPQAMRAAVQGFHWGNITDYAEVLAASPAIIGAALPRDQVRAAFQQSAAAVFDGDAALFGLDQPLPEAQQAERAQMQFDAHCGAMPLAMMGGMIEAQRLRDAAFAKTVLAALEAHGRPVVLITGNGHARADWGVPVYLAKAAPDLVVVSIGQSEDGIPFGGAFETNWDAPAPERGDPCEAFR